MYSSFFCPSNSHSVGRYFFQYCRKNSRVVWDKMEKRSLPPLPSFTLTVIRLLSISVNLRRAVSLALNPEEYVIIRIALCLRFFVTAKRASTSERSRTTGSFLLLRGDLIFSTGQSRFSVVR